MKVRHRSFLLVAGALSLSGLAAFGVFYAKARALEARLVAAAAIGASYADDIQESRPVSYASVSRPRRLVLDKIVPVAIRRIGPDHYLLDFGRTAFGALSLAVSAYKGASISVTLGERQTDNFRVWRYDPKTGEPSTGAAYFRQRLQTEPGRTHILVEGPKRPRPVERDLPGKLTAVFPFRYAEIEGGNLDPAKARQLAVHYPFDDSASDFFSSSDALNRVWNFSRYSIRATSYAGIYVDGERERKPYEADAYINQLSQYSIDPDYQIGRHTLEFLLHNPTWPTEWMMFTIFLAYNDYMYTGDISFIRHIYPALKNHALDMLARSDGLISTSDENAVARQTRQLGAASNLKDIIDWPAGERDSYATVSVATGKFIKLSLLSALQEVRASACRLLGFPVAALYYSDAARNARDGRYEIIPVNTVVNAFHYMALIRIAYLAGRLGYDGDAARYAGQAAAAKKAIQLNFFDSRTGTFVDGLGTEHQSLHANMFPLAFGLVPPGRENSVLSWVRSKGMAVSVYGAQFLLDGLYSAGSARYAFALLTNTSSRGWLEMAARNAVTSEAWNDGVKPNQDWDHAWGTSPTNIISRRLMGIRPIEPGFSRFVVQPQPGPLTRARITVPTVKGPIKEEFEAHKGDFRLSLHVPENASAELYIPAVEQGAYEKILVDGKPAVSSRRSRFIYLGVLNSGDHEVQAFQNLSVQ